MYRNQSNELGSSAPGALGKTRDRGDDCGPFQQVASTPRLPSGVMAPLPSGVMMRRRGFALRPVSPVQVILAERVVVQVSPGTALAGGGSQDPEPFPPDVCHWKDMATPPSDRSYVFPAPPVGGFTDLILSSSQWPPVAAAIFTVTVVSVSLSTVAPAIVLKAVSSYRVTLTV